MKITLIQLPHFYEEGASRSPTIYPLGLGYIASALKANGIEYEALDFWVGQTNVDDAIKIAGKSNCDVFGVSVYSTQYPYLKELTLGLKEKLPNIPIICGGVGATYSANIILKHTGADICVIGEGDETIVDLLRNMNNLGSVKGIVFKDKKGEIRQTEERPQIRDLGSISLPDRDIFDQERYTENHKKFGGFRSIDILSGRGCPYKCNFCSLTFRGCRLRPIDDIVSEIGYVKDKYRVKHFSFDDELLVVSKKRMLELCEKIKPFHMKWRCQGRINLVDEEILIAMKEAGCERIGYGVESFSQSILDNMNKEIKTDIIIPVIDMTRRIGLDPIVQYMYGYPGENDETINATEKFFRKIDHTYVGFSTTPLPGSPLYKECLNKGIIKDEDGYLMNLTSGYNVLKPQVNLTEFSDQEFVEKRIMLARRVNAAYYEGHPLRKIKFGFNRAKHICTLAITTPSYFVKRVKERLKLSSA